MSIRRVLPLVLMLVALLSACASAIDPLAREHPSSLIAITPGATVRNWNKVPSLHEKVPDNVPDATMTLHDRFNQNWIVESAGKQTSISVFVKASPKAAQDRLIATIWDWDNRVVAQTVCSSEKPHELSIAINGAGAFLITLDGHRDDKHVYRQVRSFAVIAENKSAREKWNQGDYWLGICAFPGRYHWNSNGKPSRPEGISEEKARAMEAEAMSKLGLTVARLDVSMTLPEKAGTPIDWKRMDAAVKAYTSRGFELALQLMHPPDWAMEEKYKGETKDLWRYPRREEPYRRYVREIVERYGRQAKFVQVYNEPDQLEFWAASSAEYVTEVKRAREEIRKALPDAPITNGGYAFIDPSRTEYFTKELKGDTDLQAYHSHGNLRELMRDMEHMRTLHRDAKYDKPRYINTECGFAAWRLDQERAQAASVVQKILYSWAHGDEGMLLFASRMTKAPGRSGRDFGFLDYDFCPRFVYGAVGALVARLAGARFDRVLLESADLHAYVFKRGDERVVAFFSIGASKSINLTTDAKRVRSFDAMGNEAGLVTDRNGNISVTAGALARWIVMEQVTRVELAR